MPNKHFHFLGMLLFLLVFTNCQSSPEETNAPPTPAELAKALNITIDCEMPLLPGCKNFHEGTDSLKVKPACARAFISYWECFADALNRQMTSPYQELLKYGFQIPKGELEDIIKDDKDGLIWAMLTIIPDEEGNLRPDLFFQGEPKGGPKEADAQRGDDDDFFDFTRPCPTNCPDD